MQNAEGYTLHANRIQLHTYNFKEARLRDNSFKGRKPKKTGRLRIGISRYIPKLIKAVTENTLLN